MKHLQIDQVNNGWIVHGTDDHQPGNIYFAGSRFVFNTVEDLCKNLPTLLSSDEPKDTIKP